MEDPLGTENPGGWGGANQNVFRGGGMDIFWNHTLQVSKFLLQEILNAGVVLQISKLQICLLFVSEGHSAETAFSGFPIL